MFRTNTTLFIDEKSLQRLMRRQEQSERDHSRTRQLPTRLRSASPLAGQEKSSLSSGRLI